MISCNNCLKCSKSEANVKPDLDFERENISINVGTINF